MPDKLWRCSCGGKHTGHVLDPNIWPDEAAKHQPVSTFEYRMAVANPWKPVLRGASEEDRVVYRD